MKRRFVFRHPVVLLYLSSLCVLLSPPLDGAGQVVLTALPETGTLDGMRSIALMNDGTYSDRSSEGMRVGTSPGETRICVFKPAFPVDVSRYRNWTVVDVAYKVAGTAAELHRPLRYWSGVTPAAEVYSLPRSDLTTSYVLDMFQVQLSAGGNYARTTGIFVTSTAPLNPVALLDVRFAVTIRDPSPFRVEAISLAPSAGGTLLFSWRSSRRGYAEIWVNDVQRVRNQFTVAERINRNTIYADWLNAGTVNSVYVKVTEPEDLSSVAVSDTLTATP